MRQPSSVRRQVRARWRDALKLIERRAASDPDRAQRPTPDVLILTPYFPPAELAGGPARTLEAMIASASPGTVAAVLTSAYDLGQKETMDVVTDAWSRHGSIAVRYTTGGRLQQVRGIARTRGMRPVTVYLNSLFHPAYSIVPTLLYRLGWWHGAQLVIAPRGELDPGALNLKSRKKALFITLVRSAGLYRNVLWHASTTGEAENISAQFSESRVFVRENETLLTTSSEPVHPTERRRIVFLSRISPKKGLTILLRALTDVTVPVQLDIYGNEEDPRYSQECHELAGRLPENVVARFMGPLRHTDVVPTLADYDLHPFPTYGENFGHVIAESLSAGCPVMLAPVTPWTEAARATRTAVSDLEPATWTKALQDYLSQPADIIYDLKLAAQQHYISGQAASAGAVSTLDLLSKVRNGDSPVRMFSDSTQGRS